MSGSGTSSEGTARMREKRDETMIVRRALRGEAADVLAFYHDLIDRMQGQPYCPYWTKGVYPTHGDIDLAIGRENMFLAVEGAAIAGALILNHAQAPDYAKVNWATEAAPERVGVIHLLAVHPAFQGRGVGRRLLARAVEESRSRGDAVIRLDTLTWNLPGRRLYEGFGFRYCGDFEQTYPTTGTIPFSMYELPIPKDDVTE